MISTFGTSTLKATVQNFGAMVTASFFKGDRWIDPFWHSPFETSDDDFLRNLRGDFFCVPFGADISPQLDFLEWQIKKNGEETKGWQHGYSSHGEWNQTLTNIYSQRFEIEYPKNSDIEKIERVITADQDVLNIKNIIYSNKNTSPPVGIHPIFRLPEKPDEAQLVLPKYQGCFTYPGKIDKSSVFKPNTECEVNSVPCFDGTFINATALPLSKNAEELLWLGNVAEGKVVLKNHAEKYEVELTWNNKKYPNLLLWFSCRGREHFPWNKRNLCLGIEPVASAFDLGSEISCADNPLAQKGYKTSANITKGQTNFKHTIEVRCL